MSRELTVEFTSKRCTVCGEVKPSSKFFRNKYAQDGRKAQCKSCSKAYAQSEVGKASVKRHDQTDKRKQSTQKHNQTDKRKLSTKRYTQSYKRKRVQEKYKQSDKGKQADKKGQSIRRTRKSQAGGSYSSDEWYNLCKFYDFYCLKCNQLFSFNELTPDHIKPVAKGGSSFIWNIQPLCMRCNKRKGAREIDYRKSLPDWINRDGPIWQQDTLF